MAIRQQNVHSLTVLAGIENSYTFPREVSSLEIQAKEDDDGLGTDADGRGAWEAGETADGGDYFIISPDWWPESPINLRANTTIYLRSAIANEFKILWGES